MGLLEKAGIRVPKFRLIETADQAEQVAASGGKSRRLSIDSTALPLVSRLELGDDLVMKAQVLAGGRGKGTFDSGLKGGVKMIFSYVTIQDWSISDVSIITLGQMKLNKWLRVCWDIVYIRNRQVGTENQCRNWWCVRSYLLAEDIILRVSTRWIVEYLDDCLVFATNQWPWNVGSMARWSSPRRKVEVTSKKSPLKILMQLFDIPSISNTVSNVKTH